MAKIEKNALTGITVGQAMRRQVNHVSQTSSISNAINILIKYKISAVLTTRDDQTPAGVLSKTDVMGAYYAGLPIESELQDIMSSPPLFCSQDLLLEKALEMMRDRGVYRLYVLAPEDEAVVGALAYPDIVGMLYKHCYYCEYSILSQRNHSLAEAMNRMRVEDVMTEDVKAVNVSDSLSHVMEELSMYQMGAILVTDGDRGPVGVISKTDLVLAYKHGVDPVVPASTIMTKPVRSCNAQELLEDALRKMIFSDIHRLFVNRDGSDEIIGVFSLSDAARSRSGSCHACISSRIKLEG